MISSRKIDTKNSLIDGKNLNAYNVNKKEGLSVLNEPGAIKNEKKLISEINQDIMKKNEEKKENEIKKEDTFEFQLSNQFQNIIDIIKKELEFRELQQRGLFAIINHQNVNNYLLKLYFNNDLISLAQLFQFTKNMNYISINFPNIFNKIQNSLFNNSFQYEINQKKNNGPGNYETGFKIPANCPRVKEKNKVEFNTNFIGNEIIKQKNNESTEATINIDDIISGKEKRTVIRLNPIPPKYYSFDIIKLISRYFRNESWKGIIKAIYTPFSQKKRGNFGFCFIMLANPKYVIDFYNKINGVIFRKKKCNKPCKVIWADIQGDDFLKPKDPHRRPIIFKI